MAQFFDSLGDYRDPITMIAPSFSQGITEFANIDFYKHWRKFPVGCDPDIEFTSLPSKAWLQISNTGEYIKLGMKVRPNRVQYVTYDKNCFAGYTETFTYKLYSNGHVDDVSVGEGTITINTTDCPGRNMGINYETDL